MRVPLLRPPHCCAEQSRVVCMGGRGRSRGCWSCLSSIPLSTPPIPLMKTDLITLKRPTQQATTLNSTFQHMLVCQIAFSGLKIMSLSVLILFCCIFFDHLAEEGAMLYFSWPATVFVTWYVASVSFSVEAPTSCCWLSLGRIQCFLPCNTASSLPIMFPLHDDQPIYHFSLSRLSMLLLINFHITWAGDYGIFQTIHSACTISNTIASYIAGLRWILCKWITVLSW